MNKIRKKSLRGIRRGSDVLLGVLLQNKRIVALIVLVLLAIVIFSNLIVPALVIISLGLISGFSTSYKRIIRVPPAIELTTFTTVIVSLAYGPVVGALYALIVTFAAEILTNALDIFVISFMPSRVVIALTAGFFFDLSGQNIILTGLASIILYNVLAQPLYLLMADVEMRMKSVFFILLNIGSNFVIFTVLGRIMVRLLGIQ